MSTADGRSRPTNGSADTNKVRRHFIGGSDARIIMGNDEAALIRLWREKRGEVEPEDLSSNLIVQLGLATEELNRRWYQTNSGQVLTDIQRQIWHPVLRWMAATLDGRVEATGDLDAPDLLAPAPVTSAPKEPKDDSKRASNGGSHPRPKPAPVKTELSLVLSASLRDELLREIESLNGNDEAALWARRRGGAKNSLNAADAEQVEQSFKGRLAPIANEPTNEPATAAVRGHRDGHSKGRRRAALVEKSVLALPTPRRIRDLDHVKSVAKEPCLVCGRRPADAHHLRFAQPPALGRKVSDEFTVPLCRGHHREVHRCGDEAVWWSNIGIDPIDAARVLWLKTHPLPIVTDQLSSKMENEPNLTPATGARQTNMTRRIITK